MTRCYRSGSEGEWWNSQPGCASLLPCTGARNNGLRQRCVVLYKTSPLARTCHGLPGVFSVRRDWALQTHLHRTWVIPAKVNENCACAHERRDPFVYNKGESFSHLCVVTLFESYGSIFSPKIPCFSPLSQTLNKHMGRKKKTPLLKELNGLPKSRLLLWKQCWINYHSQTEKQRMAGGKKRRKEKKKPLKKYLLQMHHTNPSNDKSF